MPKFVACSSDKTVGAGGGDVACFTIGPSVDVANVHSFAASEIAKGYPDSSRGQGGAEVVGVYVW